MKIKIQCILFFSFLLMLPSVKGQKISVSSKNYAFLREDLNCITFPGDSNAFVSLFGKLQNLILKGTRQINIVHLGGSHIQADFYTHQMRHLLQTDFPGYNAGRGFVFPYSTAKTNNPFNYSVQTTGIWESCRNVESKKNCTLGLSGIMVSTTDTAAQIGFNFTDKDSSSYEFNHVRIFFERGENSFVPNIANSHFREVQASSDAVCIEFKSDSLFTSFQLTLEKTESIQQSFTLYGIEVHTDDAGIIYHSVGINGASIPSFLKCSLLEDQIYVLAPDLVVLSFGTNDAYLRNFNPQKYFNDYDSLVKIIEKTLPGIAILITVPNDSYYEKRVPNPNIVEVEKVIYSLAKKHNCGVWNFFQVMGGFNSIAEWEKEGLATPDKIHFTLAGYDINGKLFYNAFLNWFDRFAGFQPIDTFKFIPHAIILSHE